MELSNGKVMIKYGMGYLFSTPIELKTAIVFIRLVDIWAVTDDYVIFQMKKVSHKLLVNPYAYYHIDKRYREFIEKAGEW